MGGGDFRELTTPEAKIFYGDKGCAVSIDRAGQVFLGDINGARAGDLGTRLPMFSKLGAR